MKCAKTLLSVITGCLLMMTLAPAVYAVRSGPTLETYPAIDDEDSPSRTPPVPPMSVSNDSQGEDGAIAPRKHLQTHLPTETRKVIISKRQQRAHADHLDRADDDEDEIAPKDIRRPAPAKSAVVVINSPKARKSMATRITQVVKTKTTKHRGSVQNRLDAMEKELATLREKTGQPTTMTGAASVSSDFGAIAALPVSAEYRATAPTQFDEVPVNERGQIIQRLHIVEQLVHDYGRAYDYRTLTSQNLKLIAAKLKNAPARERAGTIREVEPEPELAPPPLPPSSTGSAFLDADPDRDMGQSSTPDAISDTDPSNQ